MAEYQLNTIVSEKTADQAAGGALDTMPKSRIVILTPHATALNMPIACGLTPHSAALNMPIACLSLTPHSAALNMPIACLSIAPYTNIRIARRRQP